MKNLVKNDQPLTPVGLLLTRPELYQVIHCAISTDGPVDVEALKSELANSAFTTLPRFTSLLIHHPTTGQEQWRKVTTLVLDNHVKVIDDEMCNVNDYLADLAVSSPLPTDKPLWEVHILYHQNCVVFRVHHSLADGVSFMSLLQSFFDKDDESDPPNVTNVAKNPVGTIEKRKSIWDLIKMVWFMLIFSFEFFLRSLWVKDVKTMISGGDGVQLWPRKLATAYFTLEDLNIVKKSILPNPTINDVMMGVLSSGLSNYITTHSPTRVKQCQRITAMVYVNLRTRKGTIPEISDLMKADSNSGWGNKIGFIFHPIRIRNPNVESDPLHELKVAKASMDKGKLSKVAYFSRFVGRLALSIFGPNVGTWLFYNAICNTTLTFSNIVGPSHEVSMVGKRVISMKMNVASLPHGIIIHVLSYAGKVEMQILVAKDIVHDPDGLAKCFEDALQRMKKHVM